VFSWAFTYVLSEVEATVRGRQIAWTAAIALITVIGFDRYKASKGA
jgi:uncharacterized membrane protein